MKKIKPNLLKPGDKVGIISPARFVSPSEIEGAVSWLAKAGYQPVLGKHVFDRENQFAGKDVDRAADFIEFINNPEIRCIWATRGGYGSIRLMPYLDKIDPSTDPKWFLGYSDVSVIHSWLGEKFNIQSIHGPMLFSWDGTPESNESFDKLGKLLSIGHISYSYKSEYLKEDKDISGILTGGNLSMLLSMRGTDLDIDVDGKILFIEDIDEYLYHIDRVMQNFKRSGWFGRIRGILVGGMSDMNDNTVPFGKNANEIIASVLSDYGFPVIFNHPSGHLKRNMPLILGEEVHLWTEGDIVHCRQ